MKIRAATLQDLTALADLHTRAFARGWGAGSLRVLMTSPGAFTFTAERADIDGFVVIRIAADETEILTIAVSPDARRLGLASQLLEHASQHATEQGAVRMFLEVASANLPAINLYQKYGFLRVGLRRAYYEDGGDALVLSAGLPLAVGKSGKTL